MEDFASKVYDLFRLPEYREIFPHIRSDYVKRMCIHNQVLYGINLKDEIVGALIFHQYKMGNAVYLANKGDIQLKQIVVRPDYLGSGVADFLLASLIVEAKNRKAPRIVLSVRKSNERAIAFYKRHGMKVLKEISWKGGLIEGLIMSYTVDRECEESLFNVSK